MFLAQSYTYSVADQEYARNRNLQKLVKLTTPTFFKIDRVLTRAYDELGVQLVVYSGSRNWQEQKEKFAQGRTKPGNIVTDAQAGYSWHNFNRAGDLAALEPGTRKLLFDYPQINQVGRIAQEEGLTWGGSFGDPGHVSNQDANMGQLRVANPGWKKYQVADTQAGKLAGFLRKHRKTIAYAGSALFLLGGAAYITKQRRAYV